MFDAGAMLIPAGGGGATGNVWTSRSASSANTWYTVRYGGSIFVATAQPGIMSSPDGFTWTARTGGGDKALAYGNGLFASLRRGSSAGVYSSDGITWSAAATPAVAALWESMAYGNGVFVATSVADGGTGVNCATSPDGSVWTSRTIPGATQAVCFGNSLFVAVGTGVIYTSTNGTTWTSRSPGTAGVDLTAVTYGNGLYVATGNNGSGGTGTETSPDGITWTSRTTPQPASNWVGLTYTPTLFVAVCASGTNRVMTSPDGITWTLQTAAAANAWQSVAYGAGLFAAVSANGTDRVMTAP